MDLHTAKCALMDAASYARWRKDEIPPESLSDERVAEAIEVLWKDTFGEEMRWFDKAGMYMPGGDPPPGFMGVFDVKER